MGKPFATIAVCKSTYSAATLSLPVICGSQDVEGKFKNGRIAVFCAICEERNQKNDELSVAIIQFDELQTNSDYLPISVFSLPNIVSLRSVSPVASNALFRRFATVLFCCNAKQMAKSGRSTILMELLSSNVAGCRGTDVDNPKTAQKVAVLGAICEERNQKRDELSIRWPHSI